MIIMIIYHTFSDSWIVLVIVCRHTQLIFFYWLFLFISGIKIHLILNLCLMYTKKSSFIIHHLHLKQEMKELCILQVTTGIRRKNCLSLFLKWLDSFMILMLGGFDRICWTEPSYSTKAPSKIVNWCL